MHLRRVGRVHRLLVLACLTVVGATACSSPNRGVWNGTFSGSVAGTVEFRINSRGTELTGSMDGQTSDGAAFHATMKGGINDVDFYATFEGTAQTGFRPVPFEGFMRGQLGTGQARGDWECQLRFAQDKMRGDWDARQIEVR